MDPSDERRIERFVRRPGSMDEEQRREAERLIGLDPGAAAYARFLSGFYERLGEESSDPADSRVEAFVQRLFGEGKRSRDPDKKQNESAPAVTPIEPYGSGSSVRPTVLAADTALPARDSSAEKRSTDPSGRKRFLMLAALASGDDRVLVRVVGDRATGRGRLYVLSEQAERQAHVVVSFPELGLDLVADEEGQATFDLSKGPPSEADVSAGAQAEPYRDAWAGVSAVVRRPLASGRLPPGRETVLTVPARAGASGERPENRVLCRREGGTLTVTVEDESASSPTLLVAEGPEVEPLLLPLRSGGDRQRKSAAGEVLTVRLYE